MKALFVALLGAVALQAGPVTVIDLGGFNGSSSIGYRINNAGVIVGWAQTPANDTHAFRSDGSGTPVDLTTAGASEAYAYGVNGSGTIAGTSYSNGQAHGTIWSSNGIIDLGAGSYATAINASGEVAGGNGQAFVYANGVTTQLGALTPGGWSSAYAINSSGTVAGYGTAAGGAMRGFLWTPGSGLTALGTLGGNNSYAAAINDLGQAVATPGISSGYDHAFVTSGGALQDLGTLGGNNSYAYGINNAGAIVGYSQTAGGGDHAFVYANGRMVDLNSLIAASSGWVLQQAYGINDQGDIVGAGTFNGHATAFLIDPLTQFSVSPQLSAAVPEPGTFGLLLAGAALLLIARRAWHDVG